MPSRAGAGRVRWACASPSPGTPLPPCLLGKAEGCSCHFPHFCFANKPPEFCLLNKSLSFSWMQTHLPNIHVASFDKGPVPGRAQGTALHSASLHAALGLPLWSCSHAWAPAWASPRAARGQARRRSRRVPVSPCGESGQPQPTRARGHQPKHCLLHLGTYASQNPLPRWIAQAVFLDANYLITSFLQNSHQRTKWHSHFA